MIERQKIRELAGRVAAAHYALTPLAADGEGRDGHGGKIADPRRVLGDALQAVRGAAALAKEMEGLR